MFKTISAIFAGLFNCAFGILVYVLMIFSLPLNVIVWMRWTGWEWWGALIAAVLSFLVPFLGQIICFVFTLFGAYYFIDSGLNWRVAISPEVKTFSFQSLSPDEFERYKTRTIQPQMTKQCMDDARVKTGFEGKVLASAVQFCECVVRVTLAAVTQEDMIYQEKNKTDAPGLEDRLKHTLSAQCRQN
jgi:hypothetical protein